MLLANYAARANRLQGAVEVAPIEHGPIQLRRTFSGTLEALAEFVVAPQVSGRIVRLGVALADTARRGQVVAWLDDKALCTFSLTWADQ